MKSEYVVWHDVWSNKGFSRRPLGVVKATPGINETRTRVRLLGRLFFQEKIPMMEGGRNNISLTLAEAESALVVGEARRQRRF